MPTDTNYEPIDISAANIAGKCELKCAYSFQYHDSIHLAAKNEGVMIALSYEDGPGSPVKYNKQKYNVAKIWLVAPSMHTFNGSQTAAELVIEHYPVHGGPNLYVSIPILASANTSAATPILMELIDKLATNVPGRGDEAHLVIADFSLQPLVPMKPFFVYTSLDGNTWVVYGAVDGIPLPMTSVAQLTRMLKPFPLPTPGDRLFYNSHGPSPFGDLDGIYISCTPTGHTPDKVGITQPKPSSGSSTGNTFFSNPAIWQTIVIIVVLLLTFGLLAWAYSYFTGQTRHTKRGGQDASSSSSSFFSRLNPFRSNPLTDIHNVTSV